MEAALHQKSLKLLTLPSLLSLLKLLTVFSELLRLYIIGLYCCIGF